LDLSRDQVQNLESTLRSVVAQYRGIVTLEELSAEQWSGSANQRPMVERLHEYAGDTLDLNNLVPYPPQMQPVPVKPLFLDVAWNYIDYPREAATGSGQSQATAQPAAEEPKSTRRGWFGFGR
jgi:signal recognition particle subunit SRP68